MSGFPVFKITIWILSLKYTMYTSGSTHSSSHRFALSHIHDMVLPGWNIIEFQSLKQRCWGRTDNVDLKTSQNRYLQISTDMVYQQISTDCWNNIHLCVSARPSTTWTVAMQQLLGRSVGPPDPPLRSRSGHPKYDPHAWRTGQEVCAISCYFWKSKGFKQMQGSS